jgi:multidrug efflux pump subunit AcrB
MIAFSTFFFLEGRIGEFFGEVSVVVILTLLVSIIEALIILPAHIAHSKALQREGRKRNKVDAFFKKLNEGADKYLNKFRDAFYVPYLRFFLKNKFLGFAIPIALFIFSIGAIGGGIVGTSFFPRIASDRVN